MISSLLFIPIIIPLLLFGILKLTKIKSERLWKGLSLGGVILTSIIVWVFLFILKEDTFTIIKFSSRISLGLKLDGLGKIFSGMVSILWPFALIYSFVYMKHNDRKYLYNEYYVATFAIVLGISFSSNLLTMYIFYEALTFITLPLIIHPQTKEARRAGNFYLYFSLSGSSLALAGLILLTVKTGSNEFIMGGLMDNKDNLLSIAYLFTFLGFGVKSAIFPFSYWLPMAGAAPTPTTALLHAVAVVKSGAFAIIRCTYYNFSYSILNNTWVQTVCLIICIVTIIYGSSKALKEQHLKRRFAYSTVSNLSYILFGTLLCTKLGLEAALIHFLFHSVTKISIFFTCGSIIETTNATYVYELNGLGKKMPKQFIIYTLAGLSLIGVPVFACFISKYYLIKAAFDVGSVFAYVGIGALIFSAILTIAYVFEIVVRAFVKEPLEKCRIIYDNAKEPETGFLFTSGIFAVCAFLLGVFSYGLVELISNLIGGVL